jgi:GT2 family glycosyltransferase
LDIDCVVVGLNMAKTLPACLASLEAARYPRGKVRFFYVDGGSTDGSCALARQQGGVEVFAPPGGPATPGFLRNLGWRRGEAPLVQFVEADSVLSPYWWERAAPHVTERVVAVRGRREERHRAASPINWVAALDWNPTPGNCDAFGGEVLIRRDALRELGGYDEELPGYEDRELSYRLTERGYLILHLDASMSVHDLAMTAFNQYWKRSYRTGYGFAAVAQRHRRNRRGFWRSDLERIAIRGGGAVALLVLALRWAFWTAVGVVLLLPATLFALSPRLFGGDARRKRGHTLRRVARYAWHCSFVALPQFIGVVRYFLGKAFHWPLRLRVTRSYR